jgi:hypothetical protein
MKYTIEGFEQQGLVDCGLDVADAVLLRLLQDLQAAGHLMERKDDSGSIFYELKHSCIMASLPILGITSRQGMLKRMKKLQDAGVVERYTYRGVDGSLSCFRVTGRLRDMLSIFGEYALSRGD